MTYAYVAYSPEYRQEILELQRQLWSTELSVNDAYFAWKYERNPYIASPIICLALHEGRVVGMRGAWGALWHTGTETEPAVVPCAGDTVIAKAHRGSGVLRGLNRSLIQMADRAGLPLVLSLSASRPVFHGSVKDGWRPVIDYGELQRSALFFKLRWAREIRDRLLAAIPERLQRAVAARLAGRSRSRIHSDISIDETPRSDAMAALVRRVAPDNAIGHVRDASYIRWRYDCPLSKYLFLSAGTATLDGFLVLQHRTERRHGTHIVDWEASSPEVFERLLSAAIVAAGVDDLKIWSACVPASLRRILDRHGFEPSGPRPGDSYRRAVLVKETAPAGSARGSADAPLGLALDAAWNLRMICSDDF